MRRIFCVTFVFGVVVASLATAKVEISHKDNKLRYDISIENVSFKMVEFGKHRFMKLALEGVDGYEAVDGKIGEPEIPVLRFYVNGNVRMSANWDNAKVIQHKTAGLYVKPVFPSVEKRPGSKREVIFKKKSYGTTDFIKNDLVKIEKAGSIRGTKRNLVTISPLSYNPKTGAIRVVKNISLIFTRTDEQAAINQSEEMIALVVTKELAETPAFYQYKAFKQQQGFKTSTIVYGDEVQSADAIRSRLQELLHNQENNLRYALIIGDETIPGKRSEHTHLAGPTDHYYRAIDTDNYEQDINGPDISVGRLPVRTEEQLEAVVAKQIRYAATEFDNSWITKAAFLGTSDRGYYEIAEGTHNYVIDTYTKGLNYTGHFPEVNNAGGDKLYAITHNASGSDVKNAVIDGRAMIIYSGHGYSGGWAGPTLRATELNELSDPNFMPIAFGFACNTADYRGENGIAEIWTRMSGGAIFYLGSVDSSYWDEDDVFQRRIFDALYRDGVREFGRMVEQGLSDHWKHYGGAGLSKYYWESYTVFADPSMKLLLP